jgi:hypothetical protein
MDLWRMIAKKTIQRKSETGMKRCNIMMPKDLHRELRRYAFENEVSMSSVIAKLVRDHLRKRCK